MKHGLTVPCVPLVLILVPAFAFAASCGGTTRTTPDAGGVPSHDGSLSDGPSVLDAGGRETSAPEAGYEVVDGGDDCGLAPLAPAHLEIQTCCNGAPCAGRCVLLPDAAAPTCFCAGQAGGCPGSMVCCAYEVVCGAMNQCCTNANGCQGSPGP